MSFNPLPETSGLRALFSRLDVKSTPGHAAREPLCIVASITNLRQIEQAYGATFASVVRHVVFERARVLCEERRGSCAPSGDHMLCIFNVPAPRVVQDVGCSPVAAILLDRILAVLGDRPIINGSTIAFPAVTAKIVHIDDDRPFDLSVIAAPRVQNAQPGKAWRDQFMADTVVAERVFEAMATGRLSLSFEPIREANRAGALVYEEALLSETPKGRSDRIRIGRQLPGLERLGLIRRVDRWVVDTVINTLRNDTDAYIGCNISAQSATVDAWWALTLLKLSEAPKVAQRLTVEITETAPLDDYAEASDFVRALKNVGCRVALDDVGSGYSSFRSLLALGVDVVKIDGSLVRHARLDATAHARLTQLVSFAKACVQTVVVEGIETETDARIAQVSGATWLQGYLFSRGEQGRGSGCHA
ncbi:EAL domain-containing protein [Paraburkholderia sp. ZP32-5]|uniref:EAL domain-containing protein n=1 Tax=Paraburkholderia sp. ZP32-5 TaxID=2883245 RepID=UPI001F3D8345|nr:EAL domain-containing protein [Paraburkholderia sp. ZP32-5]